MSNLLTSPALDYHNLHNPVVAYSTWVNDTVEQLMGTVLAVISEILIEMKFACKNEKKLYQLSLLF